MPADPSSVTIRDRLLADRKSLLDLGTRNRLIHIPLRTKNIRTVEIADEKSAMVFRRLSEGKNFTFLPARPHDDEVAAESSHAFDETDEIPQSDDAGAGDERDIAERQTDTRLQTRLTSEGLQKRLFDLWYDAHSFEEEQGINVLYLALGLLNWFEDDKSEVARTAPLVLLPVRLERTSAADRFTLHWRAEPPSPNLSLQAKMNAEFGLRIEDFGDEDDVDLAVYMDKVAATIAAKPRWSVQPDAMVLGFFSFAKFLMYRDLDTENWPEAAALDKHEVIASLLQNGFESYEPIVADTDKIDPVIPPLVMNHVIDADSSQAVAIEEVARGRHLVIKGPPGTGKSQTITNIIAAAAAQGRKVLFVAEKMAALDVVHRRLRDAGLSSLVLELHSNKISKRTVLEELKRTKDQSVRQERSDPAVIQQLTEVRDELNNHAETLHRRHEPSELTPFQLLGHLIKMREDGGAPGYSLLGPELWTPLDVARRRALLQEVTERIAAIGAPDRHPWRGVRRDALDPSEMEALVARLSAFAVLFADTLDATNHIVKLFGIPPAATWKDLAFCHAVLEAAAALPPCDRQALADPVWQRFDAIQDLVTRGEQFHRLKTATDAAFVEAAWMSSLTECRNLVAMKGTSPLRIFSGAYRAQIALLRSLLKIPLPPKPAQRLLLIDGLLAAQSAGRSFDEVKEIGPLAFGADWRGERSDWPRLSALTAWWAQHRMQPLPHDLLKRIAAVVVSEEDVQHLATLRGSRLKLQDMWHDLVAFLDLGLHHAFGVENTDDIRLDVLSGLLSAWRASPERVTQWIAFAERTRVANGWGLKSLVEGVLTGALPGANLVATFERSYYEALRSEFFARNPALKRFDGEYHNRVVETFRRLDRARMALAREQIAHRHAAELPRTGGGIGPLGVLNGEFAKKRNHLPIRQLLDRAGPVIQQIKPIFLMSPLSIAQFLKPGAISFDLLVIDEASQVEPVDALGAVARCRQIVVVGDERQLPPTRFFAKLTGDIEERDEDDDVTFRASDAESVLDLCLAKGMPHRMLNWHYRSKHQSLIAVSNRQFYDNRLFIVPSPYDAVAGMGLKFNYLPDAHYDRGNSRTNPREARAVAKAVIRHAKETPDQSLGVATFSVAQRQAILAELELLRRADPAAESFFSRDKSEPFFVKNLENIQGDERDVIFISLGYGKTAEGYLAMSFGPLNSEGGERRLNVLISRAKLRCEVFASITGDDIDLERARTKGVAALKMFLTFAQTGKLDHAEATGRGADSIFEEQVAARLSGLGYGVKGQIGSAGFFVDLAIADAQKPGRFLLGIECDGAQYHSSRSARDRDRLRQNVLEAHGWIIHRIWSTDWFFRPDEEIAKVQKAIDAAAAVWRERDAELADVRATEPPNPIVYTQAEADEAPPSSLAEASFAEAPVLSRPYVEASLQIGGDAELLEIPLAKMAQHVIDVVAVEGPVHESEIVLRIRMASGLARTGQRIRDAILAGVEAAKHRGFISGGPFYTMPGQAIIVRNRAQVRSAGLRKNDTLPPAEIEMAILSILAANFGARREELIVSTARVLGFAATGPSLRATIETIIATLAEKSSIRVDGDHISH